MDDQIPLAAQTIYQVLIDELLVIGAGPWEHTTRMAQRNGSRPRLLSTPAGDQSWRSKLRTGSFFFAAGTPRPGRPGLSR